MESLQFSVQKHFDENKDKIPTGERGALEEALKEAHATLEANKEATDAEVFKGAFERLEKASHKMAEALYKAAGGSGGAQANSGGEGRRPATVRARRTTSSTPSTRRRRRISRTPKRIAQPPPQRFLGGEVARFLLWRVDSLAVMAVAGILARFLLERADASDLRTFHRSCSSFWP